MGITTLAVRRPVTAVMAISIAVLLGMVSLSGIGLDLLPDISYPVVVVITRYPGAGPAEIESLVSKPLEETVSVVSGVNEITTQSSEGVSLLIAEFQWGTNMDMASLEVREKIDMIRRFLPSEAEAPVVIRSDPSMFPVIQLYLSGASDLVELTTLAEKTIKPRLERIAGVSSVTIAGGATQEIKVEVDPAKLHGYGLSISQVSQTLMAENLNLPGGSIEEGGQRLVIRTVGEFESLQDIEEVRVMTPSGTPVRLGDLAGVSWGLAETREISRLNGKTSLSLSVQKQSGENTALVSRRVHRVLGELAEELPPGVELVVSMDQARFINISVINVLRNMALGGFLAVILLFFFLRSFKSTVVVSVAIPVSVIASFSLLYFAGLTLNLMTLGGLALGIGMLVDNSIVVLESIFRHRQSGKDPVEAALDGTREVGTAVMASTLTTLAVFVPVIFIPGLASEIFSQLAATVTFALVTSLLVSLTFIPMIASRMNLEADIRHPVTDRVAGFLSGLGHRYQSALAWSMGKRRLVLSGACVVLLASLVSVPFLGSEFLRRFDWGEIAVTVEMPPGLPLEETQRVLASLEDSAMSLPDVESVYFTAGRTGLQLAAGDTGSMGIRLKKRRSISTSEAVELMRDAASHIPGARIRVEPQGGIIGSGDFFGDPVIVYVRGDDLEVLEDISLEVKSRIEQVPGTREVKAEFSTGSPEIQVTVDRVRAGTLGLTAGQVAQAVKTAMEGSVVTTYRAKGEDVDVRVVLHSQTTQDLEALSLPSPLGAVVRLEDVVHLDLGTGPSVITRTGQSRITQVTSRVSGRDMGSVNRDVRTSLADLDLPPGYSLEYGGETQQMNEAFLDLSYALLFAVILVYMVLASQFESFLQPLSIMVSVPLALVGVVLGLGLARFPLSLPVMIGLITLAGIVVNNAIVFLDYVNQLRSRGLKREAAIMEAGSTRLRPILMTTLTTVLGMMPLALGLGQGSELQQPMAVAVIGGLSLSTLLTLFIVPLTYTVFDDLARRWRR